MEQQKCEEIMEIKPGTILHHSWGYDMVINDYVKVLENTGKTLKCTAIGHSPEGTFDGFRGTVAPDTNADKGTPFRLRISKEGERVYIRGTYHNYNGTKLNGSFTVWDGKPDYEDHMD